MKNITRTIKGQQVSYIEINTDTMQMEQKTMTVDSGMTVSQFNKLIESEGKIAAKVEMSSYNKGMIEMNLLNFLKHATLISKKSDISGRSVTKEIGIRNAVATVANKTSDGWTINTIDVIMIDDEFSTADYNKDGILQILEVGDWSEETSALYGMSESDFVKYGKPVVK